MYVYTVLLSFVYCSLTTKRMLAEFSCHDGWSASMQLIYRRSLTLSQL